MLTTIKKLLVPKSNEQKLIDVAQLWEVRWQSVTCYGDWLGNVRPEMEAFITEKEATEFAQSLRYAFRLLKITGQKTNVDVRKAG